MFHVTEKVVPSLREQSLCVGTFWTFPDAMNHYNIQDVGCNEHNDTFTAELPLFSIVLRMHSASKESTKKLGVPEKVSAVRKKGKIGIIGLTPNQVSQLV